MFADSSLPGLPHLRNDRLVTTSEAAVLLEVDEGALWRLLDECGVRVHVLHEGRDQRVAVSVRDLLHLKAHPGLEAHSGTSGRHPGPEPDAARARLEFELELLSAEHDNLRARRAQLEEQLARTVEEGDARLAELDRARTAEREALSAERVRLGEELEHARAELVDLRRALLVGRAERERLGRELEVAREVERGTQRYVDRLERRLRES